MLFCGQRGYDEMTTYYFKNIVTEVLLMNMNGLILLSWEWFVIKASLALWCSVNCVMPSIVMWPLSLRFPASRTGNWYVSVICKSLSLTYSPIAAQNRLRQAVGQLQVWVPFQRQLAGVKSWLSSLQSDALPLTYTPWLSSLDSAVFELPQACVIA